MSSIFTFDPTNGFIETQTKGIVSEVSEDGKSVVFLTLSTATGTPAVRVLNIDAENGTIVQKGNRIGFNGALGMGVGDLELAYDTTTTTSNTLARNFIYNANINEDGTLVFVSGYTNPDEERFDIMQYDTIIPGEWALLWSFNSENTADPGDTAINVNSNGTHYMQIYSDPNDANEVKVYFYNVALGQIDLWRISVDNTAAGVPTVNRPTNTTVSIDGSTGITGIQANFFNYRFHLTRNGRFLSVMTGTINAYEVKVFENTAASFSDPDNWVQVGSSITRAAFEASSGLAATDSGYGTALSEDGNYLLFSVATPSFKGFAFYEDISGTNAGTWTYRSITDLDTTASSGGVTTFLVNGTSGLRISKDGTRAIFSGGRQANGTPLISIADNYLYLERPTNLSDPWIVKEDIGASAPTEFNNFTGYNIAADDNMSYFLVPSNVTPAMTAQDGIALFVRAPPAAVADNFGTFTQNTLTTYLSVQNGVGGRISAGSGTGPRPAVGSVGQFYYDYTGNAMTEFNGSSWEALSPGDFDDTAIAVSGTYGKVSSDIFANRPAMGSQQGELFVDTANGNVYEYDTVGGWSGILGTISGDLNIVGSTGLGADDMKENIGSRIEISDPDGLGGARISAGSGTASRPEFGVIGEFYYDYTNDDLYEYTFTSGPNTFQWTLVSGTFFASAPTGALGTEGVISAAAGTTTPAATRPGEFYVNVSNGDLYEYDGSAWSIVGDISADQALIDTYGLSTDDSNGYIVIPGGDVITGGGPPTTYTLEYRWSTATSNPGNLVNAVFSVNLSVPCATIVVYNDLFSTSIDRSGAVAARTIDVLADNGSGADDLGGRTRENVEATITTNITPALTVSTAPGSENALIIDAITFVGTYNTVQYDLRDLLGPTCPLTGSPATVTFHVSDSTLTAISLTTLNITEQIPASGTNDIDFLTLPGIDLGGRDATNEVNVVSVSGLPTGVTVVNNQLVIANTASPGGPTAITYQLEDKNTNPYSNVAGGPYTINLTLQNYGTITLVDDALGDLDRTSLAASYDILANDTLGGRDETSGGGEITVNLLDNLSGNLTLNANNELVINAALEVGSYSVTYEVVDLVGSEGTVGPATITFYIEDSSFAATVIGNVDLGIYSDASLPRTVTILSAGGNDVNGRTSDQVMVMFTSPPTGVTINGLNQMQLANTVVPGTYNLEYTVTDKTVNPNDVKTATLTFRIFTDTITIPAQTFGPFARTALPTGIDVLAGLTTTDLGGRTASDVTLVNPVVTVNSTPAVTLTPSGSDLNGVNTSVIFNYSFTFDLEYSNELGPNPQTATSAVNTYTVVEESTDGAFDDGNPIGINASFSVTDNSAVVPKIFIRSPTLTSTEISDIYLENYTGSKETAIRTVMSDVLPYFIQKGEEVYQEKDGIALVTTRPSTSITVTFRL